MHDLARILADGDIDARVVRDACPHIHPADVPIRSAPAWLRALGARDVSGMCLPWGVYLWPGAGEESPRTRAALVCHELVHADQWREFGVLGFVRRYVGDYIRGRAGGLDHRAAYLAIDLERDAWERAEHMLTVPGAGASL
jgi:hypothetical protein